jgi:putative addiction module killer protein
VAELRQTSVFAKWLGGLRDRQARARIQVRLDRLALGLAGDVKPSAAASANFVSTMVRDIACTSSE